MCIGQAMMKYFYLWLAIPVSGAGLMWVIIVIWASVVQADVGGIGSSALSETSRVVTKGLTGAKQTERVEGEAAQTVIVQLKTAPVATAIAKAEGHFSMRQIAHHRRVDAEQMDFLAYCKTLDTHGVNVIARLQVVLNAVLLEVAASQLPVLAQHPLVKGIGQVRDYEMSLSETVPYIGAADVQATGFDGSGIRVAVLDSGIDYTHANFGGPGTLEAYADAYGLEASDLRNTRRDDLFPTAKVVEGFDFVGERWDGDAVRALSPDPDPIDAQGHGTHVADIIGGVNGVAPGVSLYAVKVCSAVATLCSGGALLQGMEFALDPNGDGDTSDAVDMINMSLGSRYGQPFDDDLAAAVDNAFALGVLTVASAGNSADKPYVTGTPGAARSALSVAQTYVPSADLQVMSVLQPPSATGNVDAVFQPWSSPLTDVAEGSVTYGNGSGGNLNGCVPFTVPLSGIVFVDRGSCFFTLKIKHIQEAGGTLGLIGLIAPGEPFPGGAGDDPPISIPALMIDQVSGDILRSGDASVRLDPDNRLPLVMSMVGSSSRGPANQSQAIKPEIGAPGASVSAQVGTGVGETAFSGTSGAAPMVAGAAALLMEVYRDRPEIGPGDVKQLLINTAEIDILNRVSSRGETLAPITRIGGGEVRVAQAVATPAMAFVAEAPEQGGIHFGFIDVADPQVIRTQTIGVRHLSGREPITYDVATSLRYEDDRDNGAVTLEANPTSVTVEPGQTVQFELTLTIDGTRLRGNAMNSGSQGDDATDLTTNEYDGYVALTSATAPTLRLPWQVLPRRAAHVVPARTQLAFTDADQDTIELQNQGVGTAQLDAYTLLALSGDLPRGGPGQERPRPDIRAVGARTIIVPVSVCTSRFLWAFAIHSWERQSHLAPVSYEVSFDTNQDGLTDYVVFNRDRSLDSNTDGRQMTWVLDVSTGNAQALFFAEHATNTSNTVLLICGEQIGLSAADMLETIVRVSVTASDLAFNGPGDVVRGLIMTPLGDRFVAEPRDIPGSRTGEIVVADLGSAPGTTEALGVLLLTNGDRGVDNRGGATEETEALILVAP